jgi:hypothetical protein
MRTLIQITITMTAIAVGSTAENSFAASQLQRPVRTAAAPTHALHSSRREQSAVHDLKKATVSPENASTSTTESGWQTSPDGVLEASFKLGPPVEYFELKNGTIAWREKLPRETHGLTVAVREAKSDREIPGAKITVHLTKDSGADVQSTSSLTFAWTPDGYRYLRNIQIPKENTSVTLEMRIYPPDFARADKNLATFLIKPLDISWSHVIVPPAAPDANPLSPEYPLPASYKDGRHPPAKPTPYPGSTHVTNTKQ